MEERRRHPSATNPKGYLDLLPASQLLKRLPTAILGIGLLGDIAHGCNVDYGEPLWHRPRQSTSQPRDTPRPVARDSDEERRKKVKS